MKRLKKFNDKTNKISAKIIIKNFCHFLDAKKKKITITGKTWTWKLTAAIPEIREKILFFEKDINANVDKRVAIPDR